jgi:signal transduction histidine kinase
VDARGSEVELRVSDNGPGIPEKLLPVLFQRFARGDESRSRESGSTGLGLAIVESIVEAHHGRVSVEPSETGATFLVVLPAAE